MVYFWNGKNICFRCEDGFIQTMPGLKAVERLNFLERIGSALAVENGKLKQQLKNCEADLIEKGAAK